MPERTRCHVRDAHHLQDAGDVGVARLALQPVGDIEDHARTLALDHPRHERFQVGDQLLVCFECGDLVPPGPQRVAEALDGLKADLLLVRHAEQVDDVAAVAVVDDGDSHRRDLTSGQRPGVTLGQVNIRLLKTRAANSLAAWRGTT